ncbi:17919_t:CDS:2 [Funneliformis geosporum]|uniref:3313_t:CDS:1 n=1 Tax=Funneliformis geosporum TaxID=1117311 RepID=A0A9W4WL20_9GLOM|nr:3313_t:CDS:2 [Funneliformis geosporum]CAI2168196.1 17919_t:CDS:2 [Funneliformis geosporum]
MSSNASQKRSSFEFQSEDSIHVGIKHPKITERSHDKRIIILLIITPIWTLLFTLIPIFLKFQGFAADIYRYLEPMISLPLQYYIMVTSEVFIDPTQYGRKFLFGLTERSFLNIWFLIGAAIYAQGSGIYSTAILAKHAIENVLLPNPEIVQQYPKFDEVAYYYRETLQHIIGLYSYATGYVIMTLAQLFAYRRQKHDGLDSRKGIIGWILGGILFGILNASVAIEFPLVVIIYILLIGISLTIFLLKSKVMFSKGRRLVLQSYLIGYATTLVIVLIWIAAVGGFKDKKSVGLFVKGGSNSTRN